MRMLAGVNATFIPFVAERDPNNGACFRAFCHAGPPRKASERRRVETDRRRCPRDPRDRCRRSRRARLVEGQRFYPGYTSYASLNDLPERNPEFADLVRVLDLRVARFAEHGGHHAAHVHPHSVVSGTLYLAVPEDASAIKFEDPRLPMLMAAPTRKVTAREKNRTFVLVSPESGTPLLWESWLRHEVPVNHARSERVSASFNYSWGAADRDNSPPT
jgi:hypothetical protein